MKKITLLCCCMVAAFSMQAQFVEFDSAIDPQQGGIAVGDINNDGYLDVIFSGRTDGIIKGAIMINNGNGTFTMKEIGDITPGHFAEIKFGDIDGDGDLDIIFNGNGGDNSEVTVGIAINDGNGNFTVSDKYPVINATVSCGFADFNNDGLLDYYFFGNGLNNNALFIQQPDGTFEEDKSSFSSYNFVDPQVTVVDINNDGYVDIFINGYDDIAQGRISATFINDGFGRFPRTAQTHIIPKGFGSAAWGDLDGDGYPDLILNGDGDDGGEGNNIVRIYRNESGLLVPKTTLSNEYRQISVGGGSILVDWDNDGNVDAITGGWSPTKGRQATSLYLNTNPSNFTFTESPLSDNAFPGVSENTYEVGDLNNDGKVDLLIMGFNGEDAVGGLNKNICGYILNTTANSATKPGVPTNLNMKAELQNDGSTEYTFTWTAPASESAKKGTTYNMALRNKTTGKWMYNPMAIIGGDDDGRRQATGMGNVFMNTSWPLYDLPEGNYEWTVQAIDGSFMGGSFAGMQTFTVGNPPTSLNPEQLLKPDVYSADGKVIVKLNGDVTAASLNIVNLNGQKLINQSVSGSYEVALTAGVYIVELNTVNDTYKTKVVVR